MLRKWVSITLKKKKKNQNGLFHKLLCIYILTCICHVPLSFDSMLQSVVHARPSFLPKVQPRVTFTTKKKKRILSQLEVNSCKVTSDHYWLQFRDWRTDSNKGRVAVMAPHSSTFAQKIPQTEEPGRLPSMGLLESDMTERLHFHFSLSCIGEGNGNPLQCSCLENPRDGEAWWAAIYRVAQSWTRLKLRSSSCLGHLCIRSPASVFYFLGEVT